MTNAPVNSPTAVRCLRPRFRRSPTGEPGVTWAVLAWLALVVVWVTWAPYVARVAPPSPELFSLGHPIHALGNLLLLVPLACAVALAGDGASDGRRILQAGAVAAVFSLGVELGQLGFEARTVSGTDWFLNTTGGTLGAGGAVWMVARGIRARGILTAAHAALLLGASLHVIGSAVVLDRELGLADWDPRFEVLAGTELGGGRAYTGQVSEAYLCAGPLERQTCVPPGAPPAARREVVRAALAGQRVEVRSLVTSWSDSQTGPARILTFSGGTGERNITLGQSGTDLVLRVRSPVAGPNGVVFAYRLPRAVPTRVPTEVRATYEPGRTTLHAKSAGRQISGTFQLSLLTAWITTRVSGPIEPKHISWAAMMGALVLCFPLGLVQGWLPVGKRLSTALVVSASTAAGLVGISSAVFGLPLPAAELGLAAGAAALGALLAWPRNPASPVPPR